MHISLWLAWRSLHAALSDQLGPVFVAASVGEANLNRSDDYSRYSFEAHESKDCAQVRQLYK